MSFVVLVNFNLSHYQIAMDNSWTVIKFIEDNTVQVVPTRWILNNDKCFWPPYPQDRLIQSIKRCEHQMDNWPVYEIKIFHNSTYYDYQTARQKEKKAEVESDLNSDIEDNNKRRRIQKIYRSDEDEEVDTILKRPPQLITGKRLSAIRKNTSSGTSSIAAVDDVNSINVTASTSINKEFTSDDYSTTIVPTLSSTSDAVTSTPKQEDLVLRKQNIIQATLLQLSNDVNDLKTNENVQQKLVAVNNSIFPVFDFPLKDDEYLLQLEQYLEDEKQINDTIQELSRIEGHNGQDFVKRVMSKVLSNELASHYSWLGLKQKIFSKLLLCQVIIDDTNCDYAEFHNESNSVSAIDYEIAKSENKDGEIYEITIEDEGCQEVQNIEPFCKHMIKTESDYLQNEQLIDVRTEKPIISVDGENSDSKFEDSD
ncbi:hypothetical protein FQA39_LY10268 [Lamprigera yunnana]|nr:hypothetical protein FQA39_LY10268 [Lamprigera yunnana]